MRHPTEGVLRRMLDEPAGVADSDRQHAAACPQCLAAVATMREDAAADADPPSPDVADAVVSRDERRRVRAALARLPRRHAVALVLRHSGLSYAEVAAALDLSPGSVGTTVRRAESALRKELNPHASSH